MNSKQDIIRHIESKLAGIIREPLKQPGGFWAIEPVYNVLIDVWYNAIFPGDAEFPSEYYPEYVAREYGQSNYALSWHVAWEYEHNTDVERSYALTYYLKRFKEELYRQGLKRLNERKLIERKKQ